MSFDEDQPNEDSEFGGEEVYNNDNQYSDRKEEGNTQKFRSSYIQSMMAERKEESFVVERRQDTYDGDHDRNISGSSDENQPEDDDEYRQPEDAEEDEQQHHDDNIGGGGEEDAESQGEFHLYDGEEYHGSSASGSVNNEYPDWRTLQQDYLQNRQKQKQKQAQRSVSARRARPLRNESPLPRQHHRSPDNKSKQVDIGDRLYQHALEMKRKKDLRYKLKKQEEEEVVQPKLHLVTQQNIHPLKRDNSKENRSSSTPRYLHLYDQRLVIKKKKKSLQKEYNKLREEENQLHLETRSKSRPRNSNSVPRYMHLYERAKLKQMQEVSRKNKEKAEDANKKEKSRKNTSTPQRITRLYEISRKNQQEGKQRREKIEKQLQKVKKPMGRSVSVNRRAVTEPLEVGLYDRGMAKKRALEMKRAKAAAERDDPDEVFKSPLLNPVH